MTKRAALVTVLSLWPGWACGESGDGAAGAGASSPAGGGGIDDYIAAYCAVVRDCCSAAGLPLEPIASCEAELEKQTDLVVAVRAGTVVLREPAFSQCVAQVRSVAPACQWQAADGSVCQQAFDGTIPMEGACVDSLECQRGDGPQVCLKAGDTGGEARGTCVALRRGQPGEACLLDDDGSRSTTDSTPEPDPPLVYCDRREGLYCEAFGGACAVLPRQGEACDADCADGLYCAQGSCQPTLAQGAPCDSRQACDEGLYCPAGTCVTPTIGGTKTCEGDFN